jgi:hypothetical protein
MSEPKQAEEVFNTRMYKYEILQTNIRRYLGKVIEENTDETKDGDPGSSNELPKLPETFPADLEELRACIDSSILNWIKAYDALVLHGYDKEQAAICHDPDLCIPCFVGRPTDQALYIQYLYCSTAPDMPYTMPYQEMVDGALSLPEEDRLKFIYELRLSFLESASNGRQRYDVYKSLLDMGPEKFYESVLTYYDRYPEEREPGKDDDELRVELEIEYNDLVKRAKENTPRDMDDGGDDYVFEVGNEAEYSFNNYNRAYNQLRLISDLINEAVRLSDSK